MADKGSVCLYPLSYTGGNDLHCAVTFAMLAVREFAAVSNMWSFEIITTTCEFWDCNRWQNQLENWMTGGETATNTSLLPAGALLPFRPHPLSLSSPPSPSFLASVFLLGTFLSVRSCS